MKSGLPFFNSHQRRDYVKTTEPHKRTVGGREFGQFGGLNPGRGSMFVASRAGRFELRQEFNVQRWSAKHSALQPHDHMALLTEGDPPTALVGLEKEVPSKEGET